MRMCGCISRCVLIAIVLAMSTAVVIAIDDDAGIAESLVVMVNLAHVGILGGEGVDGEDELKRL